MGPLENIKVVELATYLAAPTCARVLADWGADVIKVEPLKGDIYRTMGPTQMCPITEKANPTFDNHNSGKKYVALNLRSAEGMEAFHRLLAQADVFVTNNRPDALEAMHLTYDNLKDKYPRLIFAHVLGYGEKGPDYNKPGFDYTAFFSRSGILADLAPAGGPPCNIVTGMGDHAVSISLAAGICAALYHRTTTGLGEKVDCGLLQVGCFLLQAPIQSGYYGKVMPRTRYDPNQANSNTYQCSDGEWIFLAATDYNRQFPKLCKEVFNRPDLLEDPRFNDRLSSIKNKAELVKVYDEIFKTKTQDEWCELLEKADIAHERLQHFKDLPTDPQVLANNYMYEYTYEDGTKTVFANAPVHFGCIDHEHYRMRTSGPIGCDNDAVLQGVGYTPEELAALREAGAIG